MRFSLKFHERKSCPCAKGKCVAPSRIVYSLRAPFLYLKNADETTAELLNAKQLSKSEYFAELKNAMTPFILILLN